MKKIIKGLLYDTATATCVASREAGLGYSSGLYRTEKGQFFLVHQTCWDGERDEFIPLTPEKAKIRFARLDGEPKTYEEVFGEPLPEA